jgi:hypothetical protein
VWPVLDVPGLGAARVLAPVVLRAPPHDFFLDSDSRERIAYAVGHRTSRHRRPRPRPVEQAMCGRTD